jgi:hypothetical protein
MAFSHEDILREQYQRIANAQAELNAELEAGRVAEDAFRVNNAADQILVLDQQRAALDVRANHFIASQQPQAPAGADALSRRDVDLARRYGLSANDIGVAKGWTSDPNLSDEEKVKTYVQQRQRYQQARRDGSYRDDPGRVTR